jgi:hypothetical protein
VVRKPRDALEGRSGRDLGLALVGSHPEGVSLPLVAVGERTLVSSGEMGPIVRLGVPGSEITVPPYARRVVALAVLDVGVDDCVIAMLDAVGGLWAWSSAGAQPESQWRQPNPTLARDYWTTEDALGYRAYARAIASFIQHRNTKPPLTIGIKGPWGAGKTSVMRMVQALLDPPDDPGAADWRFKPLALTKRGKKALSEGEKAADDVEATTVKTVLDRASTAPTGDLDLSPPAQAEAAADHDQVQRPTVWFNPWMYQTGEQLWAGLAHEIITQVTGRLPPGQRERFWLELNLRRVNREALRRRIYTLVFQKLLVPLLIAIVGAMAAVVINALGGSVAAGVTGAASLATALGIGGKSVAGLLGRDAARAMPQMVDGPIGLGGREDLTAEVQGWAGLVAEPDYQTKAGFLYFVQTDMRHVLDLVATPQRPLVVFIDDLDRCSPGVVTQTIEAVNLFLAGQFPHCIFVLAIEPAVVAAHIETAHKDLVIKLTEFDEARGWSRLGWRFLEKIVQLPLALPPPRPGLAREYVLSLFARPSEREDPAGGRIREATAAVRSDLAEERARPRLADLPQERAEVQRRAQEQYGLSEAQSRTVADEVAISRFASTFSDEDTDVREAIVVEALALPHRNPREMKRLVNLFRFYALIVNERRVLLGGQSHADEVFAQVARLAALANRWPHLLDALGAPGSPTGGPDGERRVVFEDLEEAARGPGDGWGKQLKAHGLVIVDKDGKTTRPEPDGLYEFLRSGTLVGPLARELL